jgi:predicted nucleic acid-binding protein
LKQSWTDIARVLQELIANCAIYDNSGTSALRACELSARYGYSYFDSLILTTAFEAQCELLYSEDLRDGQVLRHPALPGFGLQIINPFRAHGQINIAL